MRSAVLAVAIVACGSSVNSQQVRGPDGTTNWLAIQCGDLQANCQQRASAACPGGYDVADQRGHTDTTTTAYASPGAARAVSRSAYVGEMLVKCHGEIATALTGYRSCIADASCDTGDRCVFASDDLGRCQRK